MKKLILILSFINLIYGNEQTTKESYDLQKDWIYNGCRDILAKKGTHSRDYVFGLMIAKKDATLDLLRLMSMRVVNGVNDEMVCKWFLDAANNIEYSSKYLKSDYDSRTTFLDIVERSVVEDNGETNEKFRDNLKKLDNYLKNRDSIK